MVPFQPANPSERRFSLAVVTVEVVSEVTDGSIDFVGAPYEFWIGADVPIGTSVGQIKTNLDWDVQGEVMYDLLHSYAEGVPFAVEERSGIVTVIRELSDFDRLSYEFEAVAAHVISQLHFLFYSLNKVVIFVLYCSSRRKNNMDHHWLEELRNRKDKLPAMEKLLRSTRVLSPIIKMF